MVVAYGTMLDFWRVVSTQACLTTQESFNSGIPCIILAQEARKPLPLNNYELLLPLLPE